MSDRILKLVFAPSASGKTYWIEQQENLPITFDRGNGTESSFNGAITADGKYHVVDGDHLIYAFAGWPKISEWWRTAMRDNIHFANLAVIVTNMLYMSVNTGIDGVAVLFNGGVTHYKEVLETYLGDRFVLDSCVVIPPEERHRANVLMRAKRNASVSPSQLQGGDTWNSANNDRQRLELFAVEHELEIYPSIDEALGLDSIDLRAQKKLSEESL